MTDLQFQPHVMATGAQARGCFTWRDFQGKLIAEHFVHEHRGGTTVIRTRKIECAY